VDSIPLWVQVTALLILLLLSAFFSIAETSMMALSRLRLRHLVRSGSGAARLTQKLLDRTDRLLGVILLGNNLVNNLLAMLVTTLVIARFGQSELALAITAGGLTLAVLVFAEITPKVIGATYPERIALPSSYVLAPLLKFVSPIVWFLNLFVQAMLRVLRIKTGAAAGPQTVSPEELRTIVLEAGSFIPTKHRTILLNLFDLERLTVDDVMTPRSRVESLNISLPEAAIAEQLTTCYHNKLPVHDGDITRALGVLHVRKLLPLLAAGEVNATSIRATLVPPYFIPTGTPVLQQLQMFQDNQRRLGLVVDEYGEVLGLVTLEDIIEEIVGEFTTQAPGVGERGLRWNTAGQVIVDGAATLRELNRRLGLSFNLDGPRTLNGLLLESLEEIPDGPCCLRFEDCIVEVIQIHDQAVRSVRLVRIPSPTAAATLEPVGHSDDA
jgi:Mg2+/Co2+ transporter CorB